MASIKFLLGILAAISLFIFIFFASGINILTDWLFFEETGFTHIFITKITSQFLVGTVVFLVVLFILLLNLVIATISKTPWFVAIPESVAGKNIFVSGSNVRKLAIGASMILSLFIGLISSFFWQDVLRFLNAVPFGEKDPIFNKDISFYVFSLPVYEKALALFAMVIITASVGAGFIYFSRGLLRGLIPSLSKKKTSISFRNIDFSVRLHLGILLAIVFLIFTGKTYFSLYQLLLSQNSILFGATYTDVNVLIPILWISIFVTGIGSIFSLFWAFTGRIAPIFVVLAVYILVGIGGWLVPSVVQRITVAPNEMTKEAPYISHNIKATRKAFGVHEIDEREISADKILTAQSIADNNLTVKNARLWDRGPLLSTFSQIQEIRTYYKFNSIHNDRYMIDGELRQTMLSPRELDSGSLPNKNWINERLVFTHGYGVVAGPVNQVTTQGLPVLFVKDLPPKSDTQTLEVERPEIYYGELSNDYVIVNTKTKEFDYPKGEENIFTTYEGNGGVAIDSPVKRLLFSLRFGSSKLILSDDITSESRILFYRQVKERVSKIAPFLVYDNDPYSVIADGKLYWILDGYTLSNRYPYAQPLDSNGRTVNYIRNSVKVVVDAYDGSVNFYQVDKNDPILSTIAKVFPNTFYDISKMPQGLREHMRYPEDIFAMQASIYATYHMNNAKTLYNKEDQWEIPSIVQEESNRQANIAPRHLVMKLPGEKKEEYVLMLPFTPRAKDNLSAWMAARNDGENYGKILLYRFPKDKLIFGPKQVIGRINQDADISRQISLWDQRGSQVIQGPLLVIPVEESLIYIRPLYLKAETGKIPELKRVIVAYENNIAMEETLEAGLARIFGPIPGIETEDFMQEKPSVFVETEVGSAAGKEDIARKASEHYEAAIRAQKEGNWSRYGEEIKKLGEIISQLQNE
ncbi:MAG: UPF0182 family protein [Candidatus Levybacteria bacterium]|nr:UPF0182 family protein [Candidatus Levybacteria bacterium]